MHKIFVEGDNKKDKADKLFIETYLTYLFQGSWKTKVVVTGIGGYTQLNERGNEFNKATDAGFRNFIIFDADSQHNEGGFLVRKDYLEKKKSELNIKFEIFLFPNNEDDGDYELLLEKIIKSEHAPLLKCFEGYEACLSNYHNDKGEAIYELPIRKAKMYSYIDAIPKSQTENTDFKQGNYFFDIPKYWDFESPYLEPLKSFLTAIIN